MFWFCMAIIGTAIILMSTKNDGRDHTEVIVLYHGLPVGRRKAVAFRFRLKLPHGLGVSHARTESQGGGAMSYESGRSEQERARAWDGIRFFLLLLIGILSRWLGC